MSAGKKPRGPAIAFAREFKTEGGLRNARMALQDPTTPPALRAELERYLRDPLGAAASDIEDLLRQRDTAEKHAASFKGRKAGTVDAKTKYIQQLRAANPKLSAKALYDVADPKERGEFERFRNVAGGARRQ